MAVDPLDSRYNLTPMEPWKAHLDEYGYVVIKGVASVDQVDTATRGIWSDIEYQFPGVSRNDAKTWREPDWFYTDASQFGILADLAQSQGMWFLRGLPALKQVFAHLWGTEDLLVSMDCVIARRPGMAAALSEGLHLDQNPFQKRQRECVQGMMALLPVTAASGGLEVVPCSSCEAGQEKTRQARPDLNGCGDWCPLRWDEDDGPATSASMYVDELKREARLLLAEAGDLILWDSRTIHGGRLPKGPALEAQEDSADPKAPAELARLACTLCMTPRAFTDPGTLAMLRGVESDSLPAQADILRVRRAGIRKGSAFNHVPHEAGSSNGTSPTTPGRDFQVPVLDDAMQLLVDGQILA